MVDLRDPSTRARIQGEPLRHDTEAETAKDLHQMERLTPPAPDLLRALEEEFAPYLPNRGTPSQVSEEVAEQRGAWLVINFLKNVQAAGRNHKDS